jgi:phosphate transport system substrate-binding protein
MVASTAGMVVLAYNVPGLGGELRLPRDVYPGILSGQIRRWDDPRIRQANPALNLPHRDIVIVARQDSSGTTFALTNHPELNQFSLARAPIALLMSATGSLAS